MRGGGDVEDDACAPSMEQLIVGLGGVCVFVCVCVKQKANERHALFRDNTDWERDTRTEAQNEIEGEGQRADRKVER